MEKRFKILVANDDGIDAPGIARLAEGALRFGDVWVVAPDTQCSGMSHRLTIFDELSLKSEAFPFPVKAAYRVGGTPADCVKVALSVLMPEKPDIVLSGINNGYNTGFDIAYSGTVGAAMEGLLSGIPAIALSIGHDGIFDVVDYYMEDILSELLAASPGPGMIWNVNFPACPLPDVKGILRDRAVAPLCLFQGGYQRYPGSNGMELLRPYASMIGPDMAPDGTDIHAVLNHYISIGKVKSSVLP